MGKIYDGLMGFVVGDALGVPFEFKKRGSFVCSGMCGFGTHNQKAGTWSDDSSMMLSTVESLASFGEVNLGDMMRNFFKWYDDGEFTPWGEVFDIGGTTQRAICNYANGVEPLKCGGSGENDNGNGSLMRILPLAFLPDVTDQDIEDVSSLTHAHPISKYACMIYVAIARKMLEGYNTYDSIYKGFHEVNMPYEMQHSQFRRITQIYEYDADEIRSTGYVVDTLEAALWCLCKDSMSYSDCVLKAVNLGGDTDTIAAVAGGLAGIYYGCGGDRGIPDAWVENVARLKYVQDLLKYFESKFSKSE